MPFGIETQKQIYDYCDNHLADGNWYLSEFDFITDQNLRDRLVKEYRAIRFAYKLYEGIEAKEENLIFEIRAQILSYATIYEAVIHYVLFNYYSETSEFEKMSNHVIPIRIDIPKHKLEILSKELEHDSKEIVPFYYGTKKKDEVSIRFDEKCKTAERLGLIHIFQNEKGEQVNLPKEIIEIYSYRNGIHLVAEQRKGIQYELELSKKAYWRMRPFIDQVKEQLIKDNKWKPNI
jgi:hypothetical protein